LQVRPTAHTEVGRWQSPHRHTTSNAVTGAALLDLKVGAADKGFMVGADGTTTGLDVGNGTSFTQVDVGRTQLWFALQIAAGLQQAEGPETPPQPHELVL